MGYFQLSASAFTLSFASSLLLSTTTTAIKMGEKQTLENTDWNTCKTEDLKDMLEKAGLPKAGPKADMVQRLEMHYFKRADTKRANLWADSLVDLKEKCKEKGVISSGKKEEVIDRLLGR